MNKVGCRNTYLRFLVGFRGPNNIFIDLKKITKKVIYKSNREFVTNLIIFEICAIMKFWIKIPKFSQFTD